MAFLLSYAVFFGCGMKLPDQASFARQQVKKKIHIIRNANECWYKK